ncbi:MAG: DUF1501 domain-containing protein [Myxococcota bacterium]|nr:DUF1501 domain-containing protein [Myxococcota bacterium]
MRKTRRSFARDLLIVGGGLGAFGGGLGGIVQLARAGGAAEAGHRHHVFAYFSGGWDVLLSLDPRDPADFPEEDVNDHRILPGYDRLQGSDGALITAGGMTFGPYIGGLARHADRLGVIRGMSMETLTHEVGRRRFLTGKAPSGLQARGSSGATWLASQLGGEEPVPHLSVGVESYNTDQPTYASATRVQNSSDLVQLLRAGSPALDGAQDELLQSFLRTEAECDRARHSGSLRSAEGARVRMRGMLEADIASLFDLDAASLATLKGEFGVPGREYGSPEAQALIAFQALTNGVSRCVSIQAAGGLDTHFTEWNREQGPRQQRGFDAIAQLADHLADTPYVDVPGTTWLDHTTIIGFSEFMRTPIINDRGGRDHWLTNSSFLLGGNVRGGVIGGSSDIGMSPQPVDLATGAVSSAGEIILPEHILRTLLVDAGVEDDIADLRVEPIRALLGA